MKRNKTILLALLTMALWGSLFPMVKLGFSAYRVETTADILLFAGIRFVICGGVISAFSVLRDKYSCRKAGQAWPQILLMGFYAIVLHYGFTYSGLEMTDSSKTALLKQVGALIYVCFSFVFVKEDRPTVKKIFSAALGFLGIVSLNLNDTGLHFSLGDVLILCASFCTVLSNVVGKKVFAAVSPITATGISQFFGGVVLLAAGVLLGGTVNFAPDASLLVMAYICTASIVSYCIWYKIVKHGELSKLFIIKFAEPVFACVFGAFILGENIWKLQYALAFVLICAGIVISNLHSRRKGVN